MGKVLLAAKRLPFKMWSMSQRPASYIVCDARSKQAFAPTPPFRMLGVMALDLPQDLWGDFTAFVEDARRAEQRGEAEARYHFLRASLLSLFAHLNAFFDMLIASRKQDAAFSDYKRTETAKRKTSPDWPRCEHGQFVVVYTDFARTELQVDLPPIDWSIKPLRNILAHPNGARDVTVADLYNLDVDSLYKAALTFQAWIVGAAKLCSVEYHIDTAKLATDLTEKLTGQRTSAQRF